MFNAGLATTLVIVERSVDTTDANGAPIRSWTTIRSCYAQVENEQVSATESKQSPYNQATRNLTLILRNSPSTEIITADRVRASNNSWLGSITGIRYSTLKDVVYLDIETGNSAG